MLLSSVGLGVNFNFVFLFQGVAKARAMGSMAILTSFVFLVDTVFNILAMLNGQ